MGGSHIHFLCRGSALARVFQFGFGWVGMAYRTFYKLCLPASRWDFAEGLGFLAKIFGKKPEGL